MSVLHPAGTVLIERHHPLKQGGRAFTPERADDVAKYVVPFVLTQLELGASLTNACGESDHSASKRAIALAHILDSPGTRTVSLHGIDEVAQASVDVSRILEEFNVGDELCAGVIPCRRMGAIRHPRRRDVAVRTPIQDEGASLAPQRLHLRVGTHKMPDEPVQAALYQDRPKGE